MSNRNQNKKVEKWNYDYTDTYDESAPYDAILAEVEEAEFLPMSETPIVKPWRVGLGGYMNEMGQYYGDTAEEKWQTFEGEIADTLSTAKLKEYGIKVHKMYWDALEGYKRPTKTFEGFVDAFYYDEDLQQNFREEDLPDLGYQAAIYLLDHPYPDEAKLKEGYKNLAKRTPEGQLPTKWAFGQVIVEAARQTSFLDYFKLTKEAIVETGQEFRDVAVVATTGYATWKVASLAVAGLAAIALISQNWKPGRK